MRIIYLQGGPTTGKTTWARQFKLEHRNAVVIQSLAALEYPGMLALEAWRQDIEVDSLDELIVVIDPDGQPLPVMEFETINFERS